MRNVYVKNGRKYIPFGVSVDEQYIPDGIYYIRHLDHGRATTAVSHMTGLFKLGDTKHIDIPEVCGLQDVCDKIENSKEWRDLISQPVSLDEVVHFVVKKVYDIARE